MASIVVNNGLQRIGVQASQATAGSGPTYDAARYIRTISVDDSSVAIAATDDALDDGGAVTNQTDVASDAATRSGQTITHSGTFGTGVANFTIRRITLHDDTTTNVTTSSTTLVGGVDGQSFTKTSDFTFTPTIKITYSDAS